MLDSKIGINIKPQKAAYPTERIGQIIGAAAASGADWDTISRRLETPVRGITEGFYDDYIQENAKFRSNAGLNCYIVRRASAECCKWCAKLAGRYAYGKEPPEVYRRHHGCTCTLTYENGRNRQDVWTKKTWTAPDTVNKKYKPLRLGREQALEIQRENLHYKGLDKSGEGGIIEINKAKYLDMFNDHNIPQNAPITAQQIVNELKTTEIGRETLEYLGNLPQAINLTYEYASNGLRGIQQGNEIKIFLGNCKNTLWAARTVIHECTHVKYGIGQSQWAECVCISQELKHARNRNYLTIAEKRTIIKAVKQAYPEFNWRKGGMIYGRYRK